MYAFPPTYLVYRYIANKIKVIFHTFHTIYFFVYFTFMTDERTDGGKINRRAKTPLFDKFPKIIFYKL